MATTPTRAARATTATTTPAAAYGAASVPRQSLASRPAHAPAPSAPSAPSPFQSHCWSLALDHETQATYVGRVTGGDDLYAVPSSSQEGAIHEVRQHRAPRDHYPADGVWTCDCRAGEMRRACRHVGAAMLLAAQRAEIADAVRAAKRAGLRAGDARPAGGRWDGVHFWSVADSAERLWLHVRVTYDPRPGRGVCEFCTCGRLACAHLGAVALRYQADAESPRTDASDAWRMYE